jgi:imidazolonepropionase-like amidohydrolase
MTKIILNHGDLIDGTGKVVKDATVEIEGAVITSVSQTSNVAFGNENGNDIVVDTTGMTIMPGMMDLHDHLHGDASGIMHGHAHDRFGEMVNLIDDRDAYQAVFMAENARKALAMGFTTIRDTGSPRDITIDVARAERDGFFVGPRILYAATIDITFPEYKRQVHGVTGGNISGPVEAVKAVRVKVGMGADWIHLNATGAAAGQFGAETELLSLEEMEAAVKEAHKFGLRCTANACGTEGMKKAVIAGVDCIEHGTHIGLDDELIQMMVDQGVGWVPTLYVSIAKQEDAERAAERGEKSTVPEYWLKRELELIDLWRRGFEKALDAGVLTGIGTDAGAPFVYHGNSAKELEIYVRYGMSEMAAIESATRINAQILGMDDRLGTVEVGKEADIVVVRKDPLKDIRVLQEPENILLVIKGGKIVVDRMNTSWIEDQLTNVLWPG